ncbi:hypothetical protein MMC25_008340 [Agyrium rufum]|nr:hypothetical protein [Agyrium rufum]
MDKILNICLAEYDLDLTGLQLRLEYGSVIQAKEWYFLMKITQDDIVDLNVELLVTGALEPVLDRNRPSASVLEGATIRVRPMYLKVSTKYLDRETLDHYDLPWKYEEQDDRSYIIVKQKLYKHDTDMLFEHTKNLRENRTSKGEKHKQQVPDQADPNSAPEDKSLRLGRISFEEFSDDEVSTTRDEQDDQSSGDEVQMPSRRSSFNQNQRSQVGDDFKETSFFLGRDSALERKQSMNELRAIPHNQGQRGPVPHQLPALALAAGGVNDSNALAKPSKFQTIEPLLDDKIKSCHSKKPGEICVDQSASFILDGLRQKIKAESTRGSGQGEIRVPPTLTWTIRNPDAPSIEEKETSRTRESKFIPYSNQVRNLGKTSSGLPASTISVQNEETTKYRELVEGILSNVQDKLPLERLKNLGKMYEDTTAAPLSAVRQTILKILEQQSGRLHEMDDRQQNHTVKDLTIKQLYQIPAIGTAAGSDQMSRKTEHDKEFTISTPFGNAEHIGHLIYLGYGIESTMLQAQHQLVLMHTGGPISRRIGSEALGTEMIAMLIMKSLHGRLYMSGRQDLIAIFGDYLSKLKYQVNQHPRKRLLEDLNCFLEEATIVQKILREQRNQIHDFLGVCDPNTFKVTTRSRIKLFKIEMDLMNALCDEIRSNERVLQEFMGSAGRLSAQIKQSVEIQQEDHGKVILVFTIVTIIFLPLSFVTSLLGMNTVDIRNSTSTQGLFWAISLPLTAIVVALSLLIGYKGYDIREAFGKWDFHALKLSQ